MSGRTQRVNEDQEPASAQGAIMAVVRLPTCENRHVPPCYAHFPPRTGISPAAFTHDLSA